MKSPVNGTTGEDRDQIFTRYVKALDAPGDGLGDLFEEMWQALRRVMIRELRRRSLWSAPPSYVGIYGWENWVIDDALPGASTGPVEEFLAACYGAVFQRHLVRLKNQLKVNTTIDGLVVFYLRNFITECQKLHDPLGYRLFEILRAAIDQAVAHGELHVVRGPQKIRNNTVLASSPEGEAGHAMGSEILRPHVEHWNHELLPGLVTAQGKERRRLEERLRDHLFNLEAAGISVFRFKDLLDPLKQDVRARWARLYDLGEGEVAYGEESTESQAIIRLFHPRDSLAEWDSFKKLVGCVADRIERLDAADRSSIYLERLWGFLRRFAVNEASDRLPSQRKMATHLQIPRERFSGLLKSLGEMVRWCQKALGVSGLKASEEQLRGDDHG